MTTPLTQLLVLAASLTIASPAFADRGPILGALFHIENDGFTPPADNKPLQALLARKPALTFFEACGIGDTAEMARQLKRDPRLATAWSEFGWTPLHLAAFSGVPAAVQLILDRGGDVHINARARSKFKNTPLQTALLPGQFATAKLLLERGADPLVRQAKGFTPLTEAALLGRRDLVDLLLEHGAEINSRTDDGRTALTEAQRGRRPELADYLRSKGALGAEITADLTKSPD
ncbi:MAG TPA: ankyrin repeat domain-containing protein [Kofleriaceae bacterium]